MWLVAAFLSAFFAGLTAILAKCGIRKTDSDIATAIRTVVVLLFSIIMSIVAGSVGTIAEVTAKSWIFLILSGIMTGASWICYFKALSLGDVNKILPIDKSSTVLTIILSIILFGETENLVLKLIGIVILTVGIYLMIEKKSTDKYGRNSGLVYAALSAVFASLTSILAKIGIDGVESNLGTAIRTFVVLIMTWIIVFAKGKQVYIKDTDKKELVYILFSGVATGASWLCYYYAVQNGILSVVVPIDKLSIVVAILFSYFVFGEKLGKKALFGLLLMIAGTLLMIKI